MNPKRILLYYPPNTRSIAMETICESMKKAGHTIIVLTLTPKGTFHEYMDNLGIENHSHVEKRTPSAIYFLNHVRYLLQFCRKHRIDTIWSHLQEANFIALLARPFIRAKILVFRHHDESSFYANYGKKFGMTRNRKELFMDKLINKLSWKVVVLSDYVKKAMVAYENCNERKIIVCPLMYDFKKYDRPDPEKVKQIRTEMSCKLLVIMIGRMIESKQHFPAFKMIHQLINEGYDIKMIVLDNGPLRNNLEKYIEEHQLHEKIIMPGYRNDFVNYMAAADVLLHPSVTEASSNVVKEMGYLNKAVIVCKGVGDFDDYITPLQNGYTMNRDDLKGSMEECLKMAYSDPPLSVKLGEALHNSVMERFSNNERNIQHYRDLA